MTHISISKKVYLIDQSIDNQLIISPWNSIWQLHKSCCHKSLVCSNNLQQTWNKHKLIKTDPNLPPWKERNEVGISNTNIPQLVDQCIINC